MIHLQKVLVLVLLLFLIHFSSEAQKIGVFNEKGKKVYTLKKGKDIDFRIDYSKLYPENKDTLVEARVYALIDSIREDKLYLSENQIVLYYSSSKSILIEKEYEYTDLSIQVQDIKSLSFSPTISSVGNALMVIGIATMIASPVLGLTPSGFSNTRFANFAMFGAGTAAIGGGIVLTFGQKPVKFKDFNGPDYFKKYQKGSLSAIQE